MKGIAVVDYLLGVGLGVGPAGGTGVDLGVQVHPGEEGFGGILGRTRVRHSAFDGHGRSVGHEVKELGLKLRTGEMPE